MEMSATAERKEMKRGEKEGYTPHREQLQDTLWRAGWENQERKGTPVLSVGKGYNITFFSG